MKKRFMSMGVVCVMVGITLASRRAIHLAERGLEGGERLSSLGMGGLAYLETEVRRADLVVPYEDGRIVLWSSKKGTQEFRFEYGVLWCNGFPLVTGLSGFYFEFRNQAGHRVHPLRSAETVRRIAFTAWRVQGGDPIFIHRMVEAPRVSQEGRWVVSSTL